MSPTSELPNPAINSGGRKSFEVGTPVRFVELTGKISSEIYLVDAKRSDRRAYISLREQDGTRLIHVHHRRILPINMDGLAVVCESSDKLWAVCPEDGTPVGVDPTSTSMTCTKCSKTFNLHWMGERQMSDATKTEPKAPKAEKAPKVAAPKAPKPPKVVKEPVKVDLAAIAKLPGCELWTKKNVKFDHERIDVQAHVLLFVGDGPRKLCFNTYNHALGKKAVELPLDAFIKGEPVKGAKKDTPWFTVSDLDKARTKLAKEGYAHHK